MSHTRGWADNNTAPPEGVRVYNMTIFRDLVKDTPDYAPPRRAKTPTGPKTAEEARREIREEQFALSQTRQKAQLAEQLKRSKQRANLKVNMKYDKLCTELDGGKDMTDSIDNFITVTEAAEVTKKEQLYQDWETGVFEKLQSKVNRSVERYVVMRCFFFFFFF